MKQLLMACAMTCALAFSTVAPAQQADTKAMTSIFLKSFGPMSQKVLKKRGWHPVTVNLTDPPVVAELTPAQEEAATYTYRLAVYPKNKMAVVLQTSRQTGREVAYGPIFYRN